MFSGPNLSRKNDIHREAVIHHSLGSARREALRSRRRCPRPRIMQPGLVEYGSGGVMPLSELQPADAGLEILSGRFNCFA